MTYLNRLLMCSALPLAMLACSPANEAPNTPTAEVSETEAVQPELTVETEMLIKQSLDSDVAYDVTESLTTEIGPRVAGSAPEARAREWGVAKFKELGFENVRIETFTIPGWERVSESGEIVAPYPQPLYLTALGGSVSTPAGGIEADVAYFPDYDDLVAAPLEGYEGKIIYISGRMEKAPDGAGYGPANRKRRSGATEAAKRGAAGVIIRSVGTDSHRFPHTGQMRYSLDYPRVPIAALSAPDADQLDRIFESGEEVRVKFNLQTRDLGDIESGNVIGEIVGSEKPEEIVLISGHLDSWDLGTGALDDGAGIGISVGAAKVIMDSGLTPKRTIRVVMFGAEETGLWGGRAYADQHEDDLVNHVLASESDFGAGPVYEIRSGLGGNGDAFIESLHSQIGHLGIDIGTARSNGGPDIGPMFSKGVPALRLQQDGTDYFDYHHTPDDTFDKIDPDEMKQNVAAWAVMTWMASETDINFKDQN